MKNNSWSDAFTLHASVATGNRWSPTLCRESVAVFECWVRDEMRLRVSKREGRIEHYTKDILDSDHSGRRRGHMLGPDRCKCHLYSLVWMLLNEEYLMSAFPLFFFKMDMCRHQRLWGLRETAWHYSRHEQPWGKPCPSLPNFLCTIPCVSATTMHFYLNFCFPRSCEHAVFRGRWSKGEEEVLDATYHWAHCHCLLPCLL